MLILAALQRVLLALRRRPWLALLPLGWDVLRLGLAYAGLSPGPAAAPADGLPPPGPLAAPDQLLPVHPYWPGPLPSTADSGLPLWPAATPGTPGWAPGPAAVLLTLGHALVTALFLALLTAALTGAPMGRPTWQAVIHRLVRSFPLLWLLELAAALGRALLLPRLPAPLQTLAVPLSLLLFALLPYTLGVLALPAWRAVAAAPPLLWRHLRTWLPLAGAIALSTWGVAGLLAALGSPPLPALLLLPLLGTVASGAIATLTLHLHAPLPAAAALDMPLPPHGRLAPPAPLAPTDRRWLLPTIGVAALLTWLSAGWLSAWQGRAETVPKAFPVTQRPDAILYTEPTLSGLRIFYARGASLGLAELTHNRFGWHVESNQAAAPRTIRGVRFCGPFAPPGELAVEILAGEIRDTRVAALQIGTHSYPINRRGPAFLLHLTDPLPADWWQQVRLLDPTGTPLAD